MANIQPREGQGAYLPPEIVKSNLQAVLAKMPDLISFDPSDDANELLALKCAVDPGIPAAQRDNWRAVINQWWVGTYDVPDEKTGEILTLPCLVLIGQDGSLCRLSGWPAINSWANLLRAAGAERCAEGIAVRVMRRPSGVGGRAYWLVLPDA